MKTLLKEHPLYKGYFVSTEGRIFSTKRNYVSPKQLKPYIEHTGYRSVYICHEGRKIFSRIHTLVADTYIPFPLEYEEGEYTIIHHKDLVKTNNSHTNLQRCRNIGEHTKLHAELRKKEKENAL